MADIGFYHLTRTGLDQALPRLLGRTLDAGQRAVVRCTSPERLAALDAALWLCAEPVWLPHGSPASGHAEHQPIWLTTDDDAPNHARFLFLVDGASSTQLATYSRIFDLFDGNDETQTAHARTRWRTAQTAGHALTYWQQTGRRWEKKG